MDAQVCCQKAFAIDPDDAETLYLTGLVALEAGQNDHALEWLSRAIRRAPKADYVASLGTALLRLGRHDEALKAFDKAVQIEPSAQHWKTLANALYDLQQNDTALLAYRHVLLLDPRDWDAACRAGYLHYQAGQLEEALACFAICDEVRPNHAATLQMRSLLLHGLHRYQQAVVEGERSHALDPTSAETCHVVGIALQQLGRDDEALPWFDRALSLEPQLATSLYGKAVALGALQRIDEALAIHARLKASLHPDSPITELSLADLLIKLGRLDEALAALDRCDQNRPDHAPTLQMRAVCLHKLGQPERGLADSRRAHALDPASASICSDIGAMLYDLGRYEEALSSLDNALARQPGQVDALNNKAMAQTQLHQLAEAAETYDRAASLEPNNALPRLGRANLHLLLGDFENGWSGREAALAGAGLADRVPEVSTTDVAWRKHRGQDHPALFRRGAGRRHPVRALHSDAARIVLVVQARSCR
jgi:tetratricopeptide (TPR) repeat protein